MDRMADSNNIKILLVDDNQNNLLSMEVVLEREGYTFSKALSGKEALRILLNNQDFNLILLDVKMPIMDGYETAELIYQRDSLKNIPIIFITAHDYEEAAMFKGYQAGAVDFIRKPFNPEMLKAKVSVFAELFKKTQLLRKQEEKLIAINNDLVELNLGLENRVSERTAELEGLNNELKALNLSKDRFLSVISHDLRNPLSSILLSAEFLTKNIERIKEKQVKSLSEIIHRTSKKMLQQLNELVDWAMQQREKSRFNPDKLELANEINESLELLRAFSNQKNIALENHIPQHICVIADEFMLRSVLQNIITNAIKYTPLGGAAIKVTAIEKEKMVEICIKDEGTGMSEERKNTLFEIYNSISLEGTNHEKGSGLGLLLVKDFVSQLGGEIIIESEIGKGTQFKFTIPLSINLAVEDDTVKQPESAKY
jgi:signal transduction histidine kinase